MKPAPIPSWGRLTRQPKPDPISDETRAIVRKRARGACELCSVKAEHLHHRQLRRGGDHEPANLLLLCPLCHRRVHGHVRESEAAGWLVSQYADQRRVPVSLGGTWCYLDDAGSVRPAP